MTTRRTGMILVALLAVMMTLGLPGTASAHPLLVGSWGAVLPPGGATVYEFAPGEYVGGGMWRGEFTVTISGCVTSSGDYYLRVYDGPHAVVTLRDGLRLSSRVGVVDLTAGTLDYLGIVYQR